ncbi:hypothetical protein [Saccharopolyspora phatthalungensis]|uniref:Uncharacterized protein n=1 Tax=Saccharopolyspora phatthalungensis TaxID=664693 RepID=A0A840QEI0_9PSEU|nr:hypothetical protein [Saccharopolyspora phatthalungensis]MBB5158427.1 hypothetical protein [Saccharopolyspora phatthalungensis]
MHMFNDAETAVMADFGRSAEPYRRDRPAVADTGLVATARP